MLLLVAHMKKKATVLRLSIFSGSIRMKKTIHINIQIPNLVK